MGRRSTPNKDIDVDEPLMLEYQKILRRGHQEYRQKHEEQLQLITTGSFVRILASCIFRMPNAIALGFSDKMDPPYDPFNPTVVLRDKTLLPGLMNAALQWDKIEDFQDAKLVPARILSELPIALHKAGSILRDLYIGPFPCLGNYFMILSEQHDPLHSGSWSDLRAACQSLRRVSFGDYLTCKHIRHEHLPPSEKVYVDQYLSALLCSPNLEYLCMNMYAFGLNDGRTSKEGWYDIGPVLGAVKWPRMRNISILNVSSTQSDLERFCDGLGYSVQSLYFSTINLLDGSWAGFLDMLDEKVGYRCHQPNPRVGMLNSLTGGEFGEEEESKRETFDLFSDSLSDLFQDEPPTAEGKLLMIQHPSLFTQSTWT